MLQIHRFVTKTENLWKLRGDFKIDFRCLIGYREWSLHKVKLKLGHLLLGNIVFFWHFMQYFWRYDLVTQSGCQNLSSLFLISKCTLLQVFILFWPADFISGLVLNHKCPVPPTNAVFYIRNQFFNLSWFDGFFQVFS